MIPIKAHTWVSLPIVGMYYTILGSVRQAEVYVVSEKSKVKYSIVMG